jgi:hypothetical protein
VGGEVVERPRGGFATAEAAEIRAQPFLVEGRGRIEVVPGALGRRKVRQIAVVRIRRYYHGAPGRKHRHQPVGQGGLAAAGAGG